MYARIDRCFFLDLHRLKNVTANVPLIRYLFPFEFHKLAIESEYCSTSHIEIIGAHSFKRAGYINESWFD